MPSARPSRAPLVVDVVADIGTDRRRVYPRVRHAADELVQALVAQQARIRARLDLLLGAGDDAVRDAAVAAPATLLDSHAEDEEQRLFPVMSAALNARRARRAYDKRLGQWHFWVCTTMRPGRLAGRPRGLPQPADPIDVASGHGACMTLSFAERPASDARCVGTNNTSNGDST
jgi:hypothetical protein